MKRGLYRKINRKECFGCDYPAYHPSKNYNPERKCAQCRKNNTKRTKTNELYKENDCDWSRDT